MVRSILTTTGSIPAAAATGDVALVLRSVTAARFWFACLPPHIVSITILRDSVSYLLILYGLLPLIHYYLLLFLYLVTPTFYQILDSSTIPSSPFGGSCHGFYIHTCHNFTVLPLR